MPLSLIEIKNELSGAQICGPDHGKVSGISYDSRRVSPGDLFVCIKGFIDDGHDHAHQAAKGGAVALLVERQLEIDLPQIIVDDTRRSMGLVAARLYGYPSRDLRVIGVTGTNGKTTTTFLVRSIYRSAGKECGLIGTIEQSVGKTSGVGSRTTPESADIQRLLRAMKDNECAAAALEVSSHSLVLQRTTGTEFDVAVYTNLSHDHLDFHRNFDDYRQAKALLFRSLDSTGAPSPKGNKVAIVNSDDTYAEHFIEASSVPVITYGLSDRCQVRARDVDVRADGVRYTVETPAGMRPVHLKLTGRFNVYNSLAAIAVGLHEGFDLDTVVRGVERTVVPGRFEPIDAGQEFAVIVDYAHTPDSLENVLQTARSLVEGRIITVVGAGGDRDRGKRPLMGEIASSFSEYVVVTSDNPRSEDPEQICHEVAEGIRRQRGVYDIVIDRADAIRRAVNVARRGDLVLIAGKGHETYQEIAGEKFHFDDREEAKRALRERSDG